MVGIVDTMVVAVHAFLQCSRTADNEGLRNSSCLKERNQRLAMSWNKHGGEEGHLGARSLPGISERVSQIDSIIALAHRGSVARSLMGISQTRY